ncbi:MAG: hypothetical protein IKK48_00730 [Firmicutes bacterium]|nr:hypothetical protein [Bacillota bacterium]
MFDLNRIVEQELRTQQNLKKVYEKRINDLPKGILSVTEKKGNLYYSKYADNKKIYLGKDCSEIDALKARKLLTETTRRMEVNEVLMKQFLQEYQDVSLDVVEASLSKAYKSDNGKSFEMIHVPNYKNWGEQEYRRDTKYPETLVHRTMKGDYVRSKSEVIIANCYYTKNIQYRSEEVTQVGKYIFAPDFKILVPGKRKIKLHEHFGMMHNSEYREKALWKMFVYIENGYRPYEDIIFTFDDLDGNIDTKNLDILITSFCM